MCIGAKYSPILDKVRPVLRIFPSVMLFDCKIGKNFGVPFMPRMDYNMNREKISALAERTYKKELKHRRRKILHGTYQDQRKQA